jgi:hypothetical protein
MTAIGRIGAGGGGTTLVMKNGSREIVAPPGPDEIYRI